jgi:hypothetical protein
MLVAVALAYMLAALAEPVVAVVAQLPVVELVYMLDMALVMGMVCTLELELGSLPDSNQLSHCLYLLRYIVT